MKSLIAILGILMFAVSASAAPGDETPQWVQQAATIKVPAYDKDVPAVVLVNEQMTTIGSDGKINEVRNYAVRILRREGREYAEGYVTYIPDTSKVKEFRAWLLRPSGEAKRYGKDDVLDLAGRPNDVYNEYRVRTISASSDADEGAVFAYSYTLEDRSVFSQADWDFQRFATRNQFSIQPYVARRLACGSSHFQPSKDRTES